MSLNIDDYRNERDKRKVSQIEAVMKLKNKFNVLLLHNEQNKYADDKNKQEKGKSLVKSLQ